MITGLGGIFLSKNDSLFNFIIYFFFKYLKSLLYRSQTIIYQNRYDKNFFKKNIIKKIFNYSWFWCESQIL